ncbi:MAG: hypothetical protein ABH830_02695, partial [Patescibacteria group bacterium]
MKIAEFLGEGKIVKDFPWQQYSVLNEYFTDQHFLYHIILGVLILIMGPLVGTKFSIILLGSLFIFLFGLILYLLKIKGSAGWALLLLITIPLSFRLGLVKATPLSLMFLFLGIFLLIKNKPKGLFGLSFFYVWAYGGFPLLIGVAFLYVVIDFIYTRKLKENIILFSSCVLGIIAGVIIHPYFPNNIFYYWQQFVQIGIINYQDKIGVGGEWYPYAIYDLMAGAPILFLILLIALFLFGFNIKKLK